MTSEEYKDYEESVKQLMDREGITNLSKADDDEAHFSWRPCECCQRPLGGDRIVANGYNPATKEVQTYTICADCEYYAEYGRLDDMTMMDMGDTNDKAR